MTSGYGSSQYANHIRPRCITGKIAAWITAKIVIVSVSRLIDVRHGCSSR